MHVARSLFVVVAAALMAGCADKAHNESSAAGPAPKGTVPGAPPAIHLVSDVSRGEWRMPAGDYGALRYSTLDAINTSNVRNLRVITTFSTGIPRGHEGQPLVFDNTMYVVTPYPNNLIAIDLTKPGSAVKWIYEPHPDPVS